MSLLLRNITLHAKLFILGADYTISNYSSCDKRCQITIYAGETIALFVFNVIDDKDSETNESVTFHIDIGTLQRGLSVIKDKTTVIIIDDDSSE